MTRIELPKTIYNGRHLYPHLAYWMSRHYSVIACQIHTHLVECFAANKIKIQSKQNSDVDYFSRQDGFKILSSRSCFSGSNKLTDFNFLDLVMGNGSISSRLIPTAVKIITIGLRALEAVDPFSVQQEPVVKNLSSPAYPNEHLAVVSNVEPQKTRSILLDRILSIVMRLISRPISICLSAILRRRRRRHEMSRIYRTTQ